MVLLVRGCQEGSTTMNSWCRAIQVKDTNFEKTLAAALATALSISLTKHLALFILSEMVFLPTTEAHHSDHMDKHLKGNGHIKNIRGMLHHFLSSQETIIRGFLILSKLNFPCVLPFTLNPNQFLTHCLHCAQLTNASFSSWPPY